MLGDKSVCQLCIPGDNGIEDLIVLLNGLCLTLRVFNGCLAVTLGLPVQRTQGVPDDGAAAEGIDGVVESVVHLSQPFRIHFREVKFLQLVDADVRERELEQALVARLSDFLLELGTGFAFVGKQVHLVVGGEDFYIDLLFYHIKLHCYVVIELKTTDFKPEHLGQLGFYVTAVDEQMRSSQDAPTIGLLLCKNKNRVVAEYALRDANRPIGISKYELTSALSEEWKSSLPSVEDIERELSLENDINEKGESHEEK